MSPNPLEGRICDTPASAKRVAGARRTVSAQNLPMADREAGHSASVRTAAGLRRDRRTRQQGD